jgi:hypothetical protein
MKIQKIGSVNGWSPLKAGEIKPYAAVGYRKTDIIVNAQGYVEIWAATDQAGKDAVLVGVATDETAKFEMSYTETQYVQFKFGKDAQVFLKNDELDQTVERDEKPTFTSVEPMSARNRHMDIMEMLARQNQMMLQSQMAKQAQRIKQLEAQVNVATTEAVVEATPQGQAESEGDAGAE